MRKIQFHLIMLALTLFTGVTVILTPHNTTGSGSTGTNNVIITRVQP